MDQNDDQADVLQLTAEERRVITEARARGLSAGQLLEHAAEKPKGDTGDANKPMTRAEFEATLQTRDKREALQRAQAQRVAQMQDRVRTRVAGNSRLAGKDRRIKLVSKQVLDRIGETSALVEAKNEADFYKALDGLVDEVVQEELADIDGIAGARSEADLDAALDAEREGGPGTGGPATTSQGDTTPTPDDQVDWAENPIYGLGVNQPSEVDNEQAFQRDVAGFGKKHGMKISA